MLRATEYVVPALELIDGRSKYPRTIVDNIADNAACGAAILGGRAVRPLDVGLRWVGALIHKNASVEESGVSAAVLGHPAHGVAWLANKLARFETTLEAGHIVLAGSFTRPVAVAAGDTIHVDYGATGVDWGAVRVDHATRNRWAARWSPTTSLAGSARRSSLPGRPLLCGRT